MLHTRELTRALRRIAAPAAAASGDAGSVLAVGRDGVELAAERADALRIAEWERIVSVGVGTSPAGAHRVRTLVLAVLAPAKAPAESAAARAVTEALAARRRPRTVLIPLIVASPAPLGWRVADDRTFLLALDRLRRAQEEHR